MTSPSWIAAGKLSKHKVRLPRSRPSFGGFRFGTGLASGVGATDESRWSDSALADLDRFVGQIVLQVLRASFQYRLAGDRLVMLRVFHGRETRE
jgi:hypothetical protein